MVKKSSREERKGGRYLQRTAIYSIYHWVTYTRQETIHKYEILNLRCVWSFELI